MLLHGATGKGGDHRTRFLCGALELEIWCLCALTHVLEAFEETEDVGGVLRPARHAQVEFTDPLVAVLMQELFQPLLQESRQATLLIGLCQVSSRSMLEQVHTVLVGTNLLREVPEG